jgi:ribonuclease G
MSKEMIISVNGREKKIAILDNGRVSEFYIERGEENSGIAGNIYKGRVQRVLPGMQSAFVSIGLERDAFLYVSDFFDEEEEIERIVMEKSKKTSPDEAKREAVETVDRARHEREKQMESVQELAEPIAESGAAAVVEDDEGRGGRRGRRGKRDRGQRDEVHAEPSSAGEKQDRELRPTTPPVFEFDDSGFERVIDDDETPGEMFKDAYMQEAIVDQVRAVEFEMESSGPAEVGSLIDLVSGQSSPFERIADEDETSAEPDKKTRGRKKKGDEPAGEVTKKARKKAAPKEKAAKAKSTRGKKKVESSEAGETAEVLPDSEASEKASDEIAEMTVRRGGRGRRRGGRGRQKADTVGTGEETDVLDEVDGSAEVVEVAADTQAVEISAVEEKAPERVDEREPRSRESRNERGDRSARGNEQRRDNRESRPKNGDGRRQERGDRGRDRSPQPTISDLLREGQEILVQIAKEPIARKGARITSHIALPGRFLVYMPTIEHLGVSRKIESSNERGRLRTLIQRIRQDEDIPSGGFIVRTAGIGISEEDLRQDARYLVRTWLDIKKASEKAKSPAIVHQDLDIVQRLLRDQLSDDFTAIRVDSEEEYLRTVEFVNRIQPRLVNRVKLYTREDPILDAFNVQEEIDKALKPRVWLRSGGYLVINQTEALVAIDVNTGKFVGKGNARLEDTITRTNMEAVDEIARQIRLRDLGGIIVLDLIDMEDRKNRHKVYQALQDALHSDKSPTKVLSFNDFGLIIMTRKRVKQSLERTMCAPCEYCDGAGWVKSPSTVCYEILSEARRLSKQLDDVRQTTLRVHPEVAKVLRSTEREVFDEIEAYLTTVDMTADPSIHQEQFDFAFI